MSSSEGRMNVYRLTTIQWVRISFVTATLAVMLMSCDTQKQFADTEFDTRVTRPAYTSDYPKVLFDEAHKNIHTSDGLYKPFVDLIRNDGYEVVPNREPFTAPSLSGFNILIIANALGTNDSNDSSAFTQEECSVVRSWVEAGGSLLLITDHAPTGSAARRLADEFTVEMSMGFTEDSLHYDVSSGDFSQLLFTRENGLLVDHPITAGRDVSERINRVMSFTGQSMKGPEGAIGFLALGISATNRPPDITIEKAGGDTRVIITYGDPVSADGYAQALAFRCGAGRVVMLGEAAMLTAQRDGKTKQPFGMNVKAIDNRQLALNIMHWLSGLL